VTNRLTGNFPGSPIELEFVFQLDSGKIVSLEIRSREKILTPAALSL
jgi:hypothetical protein